MLKKPERDIFDINPFDGKRTFIIMAFIPVVKGLIFVKDFFFYTSHALEVPTHLYTYDTNT